MGGIVISFPTEKSVSLQPEFTNQLSVEPIQQIAKSITVKVLSKGFLGTGTIIDQQGKVYTVITNNHVLNAAIPPYQVQTPDGRIYSAQTNQGVNLKYDLGLLQFNTAEVYQVASIGNSSKLTVGDKIFVGGFTQKTPYNKMIFTNGNISLLLDKPLEGGYEIGYTNDIIKGMSGGPVLNVQGQLVGINGLHKDPLWEAPDLYADGSQPCKPLQDIITDSSWAIPIKIVMRFAPKLLQIKPSSLSRVPLKSESRFDSQILQMRAKAATAKNCITEGE